MLDFQGQVVFLTGAAGEIGMTTAELFLQRGATVVSTDVVFQEGSDYIDFKALGYKGDPIETGGRFTKLLFGKQQ